MNEPLVLSEDHDRVRLLTLNRPAAYNALSLGLIDALEDALAAALACDGVGALVLAGAGRGFCAGHDLRELAARRDPDFLEDLFHRCGRLMTAIVESPKPVIAAVHGVATAAGCQLVASCDLAVAGRSARFATPGVSIGLFCSTPMVALTRNVARKHAMEMLLLGDTVDAERAAAMGLVNRVVADGEECATALELGRRISAHSPLTLRLGKAAVQTQLEQPLDAAYRHCSAVMVRNMLAADAAEGIDAFLARRAPNWTGH